jgi:ABC-type glutathione transport system ATPase component
VRLAAGEAEMATGGESAVSARDLSVHYRTRDSASYSLAVSGVSFDIARGEVLGVVGESGSGKSTLARAVAVRTGEGTIDHGVAEICGGSLPVSGHAVRNSSARKRSRLTLKVGYLAQDAAVRLDPRLTVAENVAEPIFQRDRRFNQYEAADAVAGLIDAVRLSLGMMTKMPHELSSGQRQRVALARALILEPTLLVADEPTRGVDASVRSGVVEVIRELQEGREFSALVVSSDLAVAERVSDRIAVMHKGIMIGLGTLDDVLERPTHPYLKRMAQARLSARTTASSS